MKTIYRNMTYVFASVMLVTISFRANAIEKLEVITEENSKVITLKMDSPIGEAMDVALLNNRERVIYEDQIASLASFEDTYDLGHLEDGTYTLVSSVSNMRLHRILEVNGSDVELVDSYTTFKPQFKMIDGMLVVHYVIEGTKDIGISVESGLGTLYDSYYSNNERIFSKAFRLDDLARGNYTLNLVSDGEFFSYDFRVD